MTPLQIDTIALELTTFAADLISDAGNSLTETEQDLLTENIKNTLEFIFPEVELEE